MAAPFLLSIAELAVIWRREPSTVHRMIRDGAFPAEIEILVINGCRHVRRADVEAYLRAEITAADLGMAVAS